MACDAAGLNLSPGESILIYGAGPVGLMAAMSAKCRAQARSLSLTVRLIAWRWRNRSALPRSMTKDGDIGDRIREMTGGLGADCGAECIGYQCHNNKGKEVPNLVMNSLIDAVKATGSIGVIGVFVPVDPKADDKLAKIGELALDFGKFWFKGQKMGTGQCNVKAYNRRLRDLIHHDKATPSMIISHELSLAGTRRVQAFRQPRQGLDEGDSAPKRSVSYIFPGWPSWAPAGRSGK